jgi:hypothetical protein
MQGVKTQTQIKLSVGGGRKVESVSSSPARRPAGNNESFQLSSLFKRSNSPVPAVDDMSYRRSSRIIATLDIVSIGAYFFLVPVVFAG